MLDAARAMSGLEAMAVLLGVAYLLLAMRESIWCWYAAFISTSLFLVIFWDVQLLMEAALQVYYLIMAVYGWWHWRSGRNHNQEHDNAAPIRSWHWHQHALAILLIVVAALASGFVLQKTTDAALPYLDSFTTWGSVVTTWMVARKVLENWLYWLVIDSAAIYLYLDRELYLTTGLFALYLVIAVFGYLQWLKHYRHQNA
ncbi:nicotinamide riboside transporter PnuC [Parahalioglobus pacificus]|uniref:Nicotinamide riboside transporter PnuC n=1 Tax=Parahalioglobus pacificus TaxID=930806 RepID=A0A919CHJ9_9GAMM|nr:nicotinamide mononucleotide transporter [Halioglobus pacificus]